MKTNTDIDIDFSNRALILEHFQHSAASIRRNNTFAPHASGVYFTDIPTDGFGRATIDYREAEDRGYFKVDLLNVSVYDRVMSEQHLIELMTTTPPWKRLLEKSFCEKLIHIGNYWSTITSLPEPIDSIPRLAMFLAAIRPAKKHLLGKPWIEVAKTIWDKPSEGYGFKKSHSIGYATLVVVHMNLIAEEESR
jgi:hypothetical protein